MKNRLFRSAAIGILFLGVIAGCGQKQSATAPPGAQSSQSPDEGTGAAPGAPHVDPSQSPIADPASPLYGWEKYNSPDHTFTAIFPARPEERQKTEQTPQGEIQVHAFATQDSANNGYSVACYDFPPIHDDPKMFLAKLEQIIVNEQQAKVTSYKPLQVGNYPGTEFEFVAGGKANYSGKCRLILVGQRAYALLIFYLTAGPQPAASEAFFDSLTILQN
jgi:hypothetical protein